MDAITKENLVMVLFYYIDVVVIRNRCGGFSGGTMDALLLGLSFDWKFLDGRAGLFEFIFGLFQNYGKFMGCLWFGMVWCGDTPVKS